MASAKAEAEAEASPNRDTRSTPDGASPDRAKIEAGWSPDRPHISPCLMRNAWSFARRKSRPEIDEIPCVKLRAGRVLPEHPGHPPPRDRPPQQHGCAVADVGDDEALLAPVVHDHRCGRPRALRPEVRRSADVQVRPPVGRLGTSAGQVFSTD